MSKFPDINLPVWMNKGEPLTLAHASKIWWERVYGWLTFPLAQIDVDTCDEQLLSLLAYQRDINRFPGESLALFRLRVKHAFVNALDAGSLAGFARIFERLEIGQVQQLERQLWLDWDVILLRINDEQLSRDNVLMMNLVRQYGRTCRRYFFDVLNQNTVSVRPGRFDLDAGYHSAVFAPTFEIVRFHINGWMTSDFRPVTSFTNANYVIEAQGAVGGVTWSVGGHATVAALDNLVSAPIAKGCLVTITGIGPVSVTGIDGLGRVVTHDIRPNIFLIPTPERMYQTDMPAFLAANNGRWPHATELSLKSNEYAPRGNGALWNEWGDMGVYGWLQDNTTRHLYVTDTPGWPHPEETHIAISLQFGKGQNLGITNPDRYCTSAVIDLTPGVGFLTEQGERFITEKGMRLIAERASQRKK
ncbi:MAG: hypothetical protein E7F77_07420 [Serratia marcescens]|nr:hypothetical protein [Serratia marcescens]MDU3647744.1 hypothetical protein [Serratia marcescens]